MSRFFSFAVIVLHTIFLIPLPAIPESGPSGKGGSNDREIRADLLHTLSGAHTDAGIQDAHAYNVTAGIRNKESEDAGAFKMLIGAEGRLRGIPIRVQYQPNWWFRIVLNLDPESGQNK